MKRIRRMVDRTFVIYLVIGVSNFIFCTGLMFFLFNVLGVNEHIAPLVNYGLGSIIWFLGCKFVIFPGVKSGAQQYVRFAIDVLICYGIAYYIVAPFVAHFLLSHEEVYNFFDFGGGHRTTANCEMAVGALIYALLNYFGQRYFVFSDRFEYHKKQYESK